MALYILFNELGAEPLGYTGFTDEVAFNIPPLLDVENSIHILQSDSINIKLICDLQSAKHAVISDALTIKLSLQVQNSIHKLYTRKDINAPVNITCDSYLQTEYESRILETEKESRILDTLNESRILETPYEC